MSSPTLHLCFQTPRRNSTLESNPTRNRSNRLLARSAPSQWIFQYCNSQTINRDRVINANRGTHYRMAAAPLHSQRGLLCSVSIPRAPLNRVLCNSTVETCPRAEFTLPISSIDQIASQTALASSPTTLAVDSGNSIWVKLRPHQSKVRQEKWPNTVKTTILRWSFHAIVKTIPSTKIKYLSAFKKKTRSPIAQCRRMLTWSKYCKLPVKISS